MDCNPVDMETRPTVRPSELGEGTEHQDGMEWTKKPVKDWSVKLKMSSPLQMSAAKA
jgi:hypothetical protein